MSGDGRLALTLPVPLAASWAALANVAAGSCVYGFEDVKAVRTKYAPAFLWFTRGGKAYLVDDAASLARLGEVRAAGGGTVGEQLRKVADELLRSGAARPAESLTRR